jgi:hypothetical protein
MSSPRAVRYRRLALVEHDNEKAHGSLPMKPIEVSCSRSSTPVTIKSKSRSSRVMARNDRDRP